MAIHENVSRICEYGNPRIDGMVDPGAEMLSCYIIGFLASTGLSHYNFYLDIGGNSSVLVCVSCDGSVETFDWNAYEWVPFFDIAPRMK